MSPKYRFLLFFATFFLMNQSANGQMPPQPEKQILSILSLVNKLDSKFISEFENLCMCRVRVDFAASRAEIEMRLRSTPRVWSLIYADERSLRALSLARMLKAVPSVVPVSNVSFPLEKRSKLNEDGRLHVSMMADPLGIVWKKQTRTASGPVEWNWLSQPSKNPYWRGRIRIPQMPTFQYLIAAKATETSVHDESNPKAMEWFRELRSGAAHATNEFRNGLASGNIVAGVAWFSEFLNYKKFVANLDFGIPKEGTYFERYAFALVADAGESPLPGEFLKFASSANDSFAQSLGFVPLSTEKFLETDTSHWTLLEDEVPLPRNIDLEIKKLAGAQ